MPFTLQQLAQLVQGTVHGDGTVAIESARPLRDATPGCVTFVESERLLKLLPTCPARALVVRANLAHRHAELLGIDQRPFSLIEVADPLSAFITLYLALHPAATPEPAHVDPRAIIDDTATISGDCTVGPFVFIGGKSQIGPRCRLHPSVTIGKACRIGADVELHPHVVLYDGTIIGDRVIVHANATLGADGFGYRFQNGKHRKIPQFGNVEIGDDVEIGAGTTIDRATFGSTRVGAGTKIDNLVQIGHNCQIGKHNLIVSQVGIAGSCTTGDFVVLAGQVGVADHVHIADGAVVGAQSGIHRDIGAGERYLGAPARPEGEEKRIILSLEKLPELRREVRQMRQHLGLEPRATG